MWTCQRPETCPQAFGSHAACLGDAQSWPIKSGYARFAVWYPPLWHAFPVACGRALCAHLHDYIETRVGQLPARLLPLPYLCRRQRDQQHPVGDTEEAAGVLLAAGDSAPQAETRNVRPRLGSGAGAQGAAPKPVKAEPTKTKPQVCGVRRSFETLRLYIFLHVGPS